MMKNILVTGGMGFIGSHLAEKLVNSSYKVTVFDYERHLRLNPKIKFYQGDITIYGDVVKAVRGMDGIIHLAALSKVSSCFENPLDCMKVNVIGTMNVLEAVRKDDNKAWLILTGTRETSSDDSSGGAYRKIVNLYGVSKLVGEICGERYALDYQSRIVTVRLSDVYGSERENPTKVISKLILRALNNLDLLIEQGSQQFDFTHWQDVIEGFLLAVKNIERAKSPYYNDFSICTGRKTSLEDLAKTIIKETNSNSRLVFFALNVPPSKTYFSSPYKAKNILGFKARVHLSEGIGQTVKCLKEQLRLRRRR